jgi:hypothetical protein
VGLFYGAELAVSKCENLTIFTVILFKILWWLIEVDPIWHLFVTQYQFALFIDKRAMSTLRC